MGGITHAKVSAVPDGADASVVRPSDWNAGHVITLTAADVGADVAGAAAAAQAASDPLGSAAAAQAAAEAASVPGPQVVFVQPSDPGAVGAGALWVNTTVPGEPWDVQVRNSTDDGWDDLMDSYLSTGNFGGKAHDHASGNIGGSVNVIQGGSDHGGGFTFSGGTSAAGNTGAVFQGVGGDDDGATGGSAYVRAGDAGGGTGNDGGYVNIVAGAGDGAGENGRVRITTDASTGSAGQVLTAQGDTTALWASLPAWTETEVDFGTTPVWSKTFTVTAAAVTGTSKIVVDPSGNPGTGRTGNDLEWDNLLLGALPGTGSFTLTALAVPGPIVGPRKVFYQVS